MEIGDRLDPTDPWANMIRPEVNFIGDEKALKSLGLAYPVYGGEMTDEEFE